LKLRIIIILSLFLLAALSLSVVYRFYRNGCTTGLPLEVAKSFLQVGVVAVAGAVISLLIFEYQSERQKAEKTSEIERLSAERKNDLQRQATEKERDLERQTREKEHESARRSIEYREALVISTLAAAMTAYVRTKKARRLLRARARVDQAGEVLILAEQYDLYLDWINDSQLALENLARDIDTSAPAFASAEFLKTEVRKMESHLGSLIKEYENNRAKFAGKPPALPIAELPVLKDFLAPTKESTFKGSLILPYLAVQKGLRQNLMFPNLPPQQ